MARRSTTEIRLDTLLRAACDVIIERGLANTRTADVAEAAGVSQALVFYHFETRENLVARALAWAVEQDLAAVDAIADAHGSAPDRLRKFLKAYASARSWTIWIDAASESVRSADMEKLTRRLDQRWREVLGDIIKIGVKEGDFACDDPAASAWRIVAIMDGLATQHTTHPRSVSKRQIAEWVRVASARELDVDPATLA